MENPGETGIIATLAGAAGIGGKFLFDYLSQARNQTNDFTTSVIDGLRRELDEEKKENAKKDAERDQRLAAVEKAHDDCRKDGITQARQIGNLEGQVLQLTKSVAAMPKP